MKRALLCPGQGAQAVGMGKDFYESGPDGKRLFDEAAEVLGFDLAKVCFDGPIEELTRSSRAQPAIFVTSVAAYTALRAAASDLTFDVSAGLSSGEWTALHLAGVLTYTDTLRVLEARGRFMQEAAEAEAGGMLSVMGLERDALKKICDEVDIQIANLNSPGQTVLSGRIEGVQAAEPLALAAGAKMAVPLNVAGAFHSRLMAPAAEKLGAFLAEIPFKTPVLPVVSNVTGQPHTTPEDIRKLMVEQVVSPVRWYEGIEWMSRQDVGAYVECGPGRVLTGLVKRIDKGKALHNIQDHSGLEKALAGLGG